MKSEQCPYLEIKDNSALTSGEIRLDTACLLDCPLNGATFLSGEVSESKKVPKTNLTVSLMTIEHCVIRQRKPQTQKK